MIHNRFLILITIIFSAIFFSACGGDSHGAYNSPDDVAPTAPTNIAGNAGDGAVSLGWDAPATGTQPLSYDITIEPAADNATIIKSGTHALIQDLSNDTTYTFSVTAKNDAGESSAITLLLKPTAVETNISNLTPLTPDTNDSNSPSGTIFDPSLMNVGSRLWMAYSSVNYHQPSIHLIQDVSVSLAYSDNGGTDFTYLETVGVATNASLSPGAPLNPCGNVTCPGRWVYEVPFLVDDKTDPDSSKRYKLFAHKYFLYPPATAPLIPTIYTLGAIVMWTAASPESTTWSSEKSVLSWTLTPPELATTNQINTLDAALNDCLVLSEGAATTYQGNLDFVFACSYPNASNTGTTQKIVLLRSSDHASTFEYIGTPLEAADAAAFGALYFSAPALIPTESSAPILIATPVINRAVTGFPTNPDAYSGCIAFPFADEETGALFRRNGVPLSILQIQYTTNHMNGACAWDRGVGASGVLMNDLDASGNVLFSILKTQKNF
jgi:hypothetical protein